MIKDSNLEFWCKIAAHSWSDWHKHGLLIDDWILIKQTNFVLLSINTWIQFEREKRIQSIIENWQLFNRINCLFFSIFVSFVASLHPKFSFIYFFIEIKIFKSIEFFFFCYFITMTMMIGTINRPIDAIQINTRLTLSSSSSSSIDRLNCCWLIWFDCQFFSSLIFIYLFDRIAKQKR